MTPTPATFEVDIRSRSVQGMLQKLEQMTGMRFHIRRARVTATRSRWTLECVGKL